LERESVLTLTDPRGGPVELRAALLLSLSPGPPTRVETLDGSIRLVKEPPEEIVSMLARLPRRKIPRAAAYAGLAKAAEEGELPSFLSGDDGEGLRLEALRELAYGRPANPLRRLLLIYSELLSPFSLIGVFSSGFRGKGPSPLERAMLDKGYLVERKR
jgi:hypothetical protein